MNAEPAPATTSPLIPLAGRIGRHMGVYGTASAVALLLALVQVAVVTRFLSVAEFGQLALAMVLAALLTVLYNLGTLQGSIRVVFGGGDEEVDADDDELQAEPGRQREMLGTALAVTLGVAILGTLAVFATSPGLAELLFRDRTQTELIRLAGAAGALGALWRISSHIVRLERRAGTYAALTVSRPVCVLIAVVALLSAGEGVRGVVAGVAVGNAAALLLSMLAIAGRFEITVTPQFVLRIFQAGAPFIVIVLGYWIIQNLDLYVLSRFTPDAEVGEYRLAARLAALLSYVSSTFMMSWGPMRRSTSSRAADLRHGKYLAANWILYFFLLLLWGFIAITASADLLVQIAPAEYAGATVVLPVLAGAYLAHGMLLICYRTSTIPDRISRYGTAVMVAAGTFLASALLLVPELGGIGAGIAAIVGYLTAATVIVLFSQTGEEPIPFRLGRMAGAAAVGAALIAIDAVAGSADAIPRWLTAALVIAAFPVACLSLRLVPGEHRRSLIAVVKALSFRHPGPPEEDPVPRYTVLASSERAALDLVARHRLTLEEIAASSGAPLEAERAQFLRALRVLAGLDPSPGEHDAQLARLLAFRGFMAERDAMVRSITKQGMSYEELHLLEEALAWAERRDGAFRRRRRARRGRSPGG